MSKYIEVTEKPERLYIIGDIHGCRKELSVLLEHLLAQEKVTSADMFIFIGDYIDRGPDAKGVVELLINIKQEFSKVFFLRGNHEDMLLDFLGFDGNLGEVFIANGGSDTLASYDLSPQTSDVELLKRLPKSHLGFFLDLQSYLSVGSYVFAHAGLDPNRDLKLQMDNDLFWIRDNFISHQHDFGKVVVFGHTPYQDVFFDLPYKIAVDTGCVYGNKLSCIELSGRTVLQVAAGGTKVKTKSFPAHIQTPDLFTA